MISSISGGGSSLYTQMLQMGTQTESPFDKIDVNGDGSLDEDELETFASDMSEITGQSISVYDMISNLDTDGDGLLNQEEFDAGRPEGPPPGGMHSLFGEIDSNEDGTLDETELSAFVEAMSETTGGSVTVEELISDLDTDGDGLLSQEEFDAGRPEGPPPGGMVGMSGDDDEEDESSSGYLDPLDTNGDGVVDSEEAAAGQQYMMAQEYMSQMSSTFGIQGGGLVNLSA